MLHFPELNRGKCKTYLLACEETRRAAIVDPLREKVDRYLAVLAYERRKVWRSNFLFALDEELDADGPGGAGGRRGAPASHGRQMRHDLALVVGAPAGQDGAVAERGLKGW